MIHVKMTQV